MDEAAATWIEVRRRFAHSAIVYYDEFPAAYWRIYCGDFSSYIEQSISFAPTPNSFEVNLFQVRFISLPVDNDRSIFVLMARLAEQIGLIEPPARFISRSYANRAFLVTDSTIKEITVPTSLNAVLEILNPTNNTTDADMGEHYPDGVHTSGFSPRALYDANIGWAYKGGDSWSPTVFELLDIIAPFDTGSLIKPYPAGLTPVTPDFLQLEANPTNPSLYYANWLGGEVEVDVSHPGFFRPLPYATLVLPPNFEIPDFGGEARQYTWPIVTWDWNDPAYCYSLCKALGFTDSDLSPIAP